MTIGICKLPSREVVARAGGVVASHHAVVDRRCSGLGDDERQDGAYFFVPAPTPKRLFAWQGQVGKEDGG